MSLILNFIAMLRYFGLPVSPDETITAQKTYQLLGLINREKLKFGLRASIVKRHEDIHIFDECFNVFFYRESKEIPLEEISSQNSVRFLDRLSSDLTDINREIGQYLLRNQVERAVQYTQEAFDTGKGGSRSQDIIEATDNLINQLQRSFRLAFGVPVPIRGLTPAQRQDLPFATLRMAANLMLYEQSLKKELESELGTQLAFSDVNQPELISKIDLYLNHDLGRLSITISNVKEQLIEIGRILASREKRRRKRAKTGKLDFRRTIRKNLSNFGIPIDLIQKKRRIQDPEIIILNDISGSTRWVADWFFVITFAARGVFKKVRVFEFDNTMVEVTDALNRKTLNRALKDRNKCWEKTLRTRRIHSDYQTSLEDFFTLTKFHPVNRRTSILILGDCRDYDGSWTTKNPVSADLIRKMTILAKRTIILNPEDNSRWNTGDSVVEYYLDAGAEVFHVASLKDLIEFVFTL
jgi:uncharacterized protein with von Willebrand factor type A (vWA) domain